jgi:hypothetical protein
MQTITTVGVDIAKSVFQVHGVDAWQYRYPPAGQATLLVASFVLGDFVGAIGSALAKTGNAHPAAARPTCAIAERVGVTLSLTLSICNDVSRRHLPPSDPLSSEPARARQPMRARHGVLLVEPGHDVGIQPDTVKPS